MQHFLLSFCTLVLYIIAKVFIPPPDDYFLGLYKMLCQYAVPVFVLISGCLFLHPQKQINYRILFKKYVKRIALAILVFGLPMCMAEQVFDGKFDIIKALCNLLTGHCWDHMWYLYMIIGLYLLTPLVKPFVNNASNKTMLILFGILFIMCSILPTINGFGIKTEGWMSFSNPYILLYLMGFFLAYSEREYLSKTVLLIVAFICAVIIGIKFSMGINEIIYYDPVCICLACVIFLIFKRFDIKWKIADFLTPYCFGIYLFHPLFLNVIVKVFHFNPTDYIKACLGAPLMAICVFIMSFILCFLLRKIPLLRSHVL